MDQSDGDNYINANRKGGISKMLKQKCAKLLIKVAETTAVYASGKASIFLHYQPKEPKSLTQNKNML